MPPVLLPGSCLTVGPGEPTETPRGLAVCSLLHLPSGRPDRGLPGTLALWSPDFPPAATLPAISCLSRPPAPYRLALGGAPSAARAPGGGRGAGAGSTHGIAHYSGAIKNRPQPRQVRSSPRRASLASIMGARSRQASQLSSSMSGAAAVRFFLRIRS